MTICQGKSCSVGLLCMKVYQFVDVLLSLLVLRVVYGI